MRFDDRGREIPDKSVVEVPLKFSRPLSIQEEIKRFVRTEMSRQAQEGGMETFEEAEDFDVDEDEDFRSPYELTMMQEERIVPPDASNLERQKGGKHGEASNANVSGNGSGNSGSGVGGAREVGSQAFESPSGGKRGESAEGIRQAGGDVASQDRTS